MSNFEKPRGNEINTSNIGDGYQKALLEKLTGFSDSPEGIPEKRIANEDLKRLNDERIIPNLSKNISHTRYSLDDLGVRFGFSFSSPSRDTDNTFVNYYDEIDDYTIATYLGQQGNTLRVVDTDFLDSIYNEGNFDVSPLEYLKEKYEKKPEDDKIRLAVVMSRFMNDIGYDYGKGGGDISSEEMWQTYREGGVAGVCRHHHSEVSKFLKSIGFESGIVTTNNGGMHAITWGKRTNGNYFLIDYGSYYEHKDPKELKARYFAVHGTLNLRELVADETGKVIGNMQTDLEKLFENTISTIGTGDSLSYSENIAKNGKDRVSRGHNIEVDMDSQGSKRLGYEYGFGNESLGAYVMHTKNLDYADYLSYGLTLRREDREGILYISVGYELSENIFKWQNGNEGKYRVLSSDIQTFAELYNDGKTKLNLGGLGQGQIVQGLKNSEQGSQSSLGLGNSSSNFGASLYGEHKTNDGLKFHGAMGYGGNLGQSNMRSANELNLKVFHKGYASLGAEYKGDNLSLSLGGRYEEGLGYSKSKGEVSVGYGDVSSDFKYENTDNSRNPFLLNEASRSIGLTYDPNDTLKLSLGYNDKDNGVTKQNEYKAALNLNF